MSIENLEYQKTQLQVINNLKHFFKLLIWFGPFINVLRANILMEKSKVGDPKAPFLIATTPRCRGGHYSFPWIAPLYPWYIPYKAEC